VKGRLEGITMKMGQTNMHNYMKPLLERIEKDQIDSTYIISHRYLARRATGYVQGLAG
jgi:hypothetical protein